MTGGRGAGPPGDLRHGYTTGACATAAAAAAARALLTGQWAPDETIRLPGGAMVRFELAETAMGPDWTRAGVQKDAGDDPDVTHGALIQATLRRAPPGVIFAAGEGVGTVTRPGLPIPPGEPAINPVPRRMITDALAAIAAAHGHPGGFAVEISVPGGRALAERTWNPRLGILGGISILGTTGIVKPYSCAAWIASIHRGVDVVRAAGLSHAVAATGSTSERVAQARFGLPDHAMLDMGDFAGGLLKYLRHHPIPRVTLAGGFGKLTKLAQGALDLHSGRSQVDIAALATWAGDPALAGANTAMEVLARSGPGVAAEVAARARATACRTLRPGAETAIDVLVVDRGGRAVAEADAAGARVLP